MMKIWSRNSWRWLTRSKRFESFVVEVFSTWSSLSEIPSTLRIIGSLGTAETGPEPEVVVVTGGKGAEVRIGESLGLGRPTSIFWSWRLRLMCCPFGTGEARDSDSGRSSLLSPSGTFKFPFKPTGSFWGTGSIWTLTQKRRQFWRHSVAADDVDDANVLMSMALPLPTFQPSLAAVTPLAAVWRSVADPAAVDVVGSDISRADLSTATRWARTYS